MKTLCKISDLFLILKIFIFFDVFVRHDLQVAIHCSKDLLNDFKTRGELSFFDVDDGSR